MRVIIELSLLLPNQLCSYVSFTLVREMVNSVAISLSIYWCAVCFSTKLNYWNVTIYIVWHQQFYSHAEVNDSYCIWHCLWWCKLLFVTQSSWQTILPLWRYRFMCWSDVVFFAFMILNSGLWFSFCRSKLMFFRWHYTVRSELMCTDCLQQAYMCVRWSAYGMFHIICIFVVSHDDVLWMLACCRISTVSVWWAIC